MKIFVRCSTMFIMGSLCNEQVNKYRHYVLAYSLTWLGVPLLLNQWYNQTLCVISLLRLFLAHLLMAQWIKVDTMC